MRLGRALLAVSVAAVFGLGARVAAAPLQALSPVDQALYAAAFNAAQRGDFAGADANLAKVSDHCLEGRVRYLELTHPAKVASFDELSAWLKTFGDSPGADRIYTLALKRKPAGVEPPAPAAPIASPDDGARARASAQYRPAREAFFDGDLRRALGLARSAGDAWITGLASYRLGDFAAAMASFETIAANPSENDWVRSAGGVWAARAATAAGFPERVTGYLKLAAQAPDTFYGMIAARKLELSDDPLGAIIETASRPGGAALLSNAAYVAPTADTLRRLIDTDPRARRAVALEQLGRGVEAGAELRAGLAQAGDDLSRAAWMKLTFQLNPDQPKGEIVLHSQAGSPQPHVQYPTPQLQPAGGFTVDKALVYAVAYQESRFNSIAVSPVGAVGLMQLMPPSAANMAGDTSLTQDPLPLFDVGKNLQLGQAYLNWLLARQQSYDILRAVAAYNGGPATLSRTEAMVGGDADSLTIIESVPFAETRAYVQKVMAAYWSYRRQFGLKSRTLDAVASDVPLIDARLDASAPAQDAQGAAAPARQALEILLHRPG
jgi:soluble lytic murein transglycosylase-like protein